MNEINQLVSEWAKLLKSLKKGISDDFRAYPDDNTPGMQVTIGFTPSDENKDCSWSYQTGDNSYTGGACFHPNWAVISLYRRSNTQDLSE